MKFIVMFMAYFHVYASDFMAKGLLNNVLE
jgi:hypothetical protein